MLILAVALAAASPEPLQVLSSPAFEDLAQRTEAICPARGVRYITPGDLDWAQERFEDQLSPHELRRLAAVNREDERCADRNGLACPTTATLEAMQATRLIAVFARFVCAHPPPRGPEGSR